MVKSNARDGEADPPDRGHAPGDAGDGGELTGGLAGGVGDAGLALGVAADGADQAGGEHAAGRAHKEAEDVAAAHRRRGGAKRGVPHAVQAAGSEGRQAQSHERKAGGLIARKRPCVERHAPPSCNGIRLVAEITHSGAGD